MGIAGIPRGTRGNSGESSGNTAGMVLDSAVCPRLWGLLFAVIPRRSHAVDELYFSCFRFFIDWCIIKKIAFKF